MSGKHRFRTSKSEAIPNLALDSTEARRLLQPLKDFFKLFVSHRVTERYTPDISQQNVNENI